MSRATPDLVKQVLRTTPVDRISAEDLNTGARLYYAEGNGEQLCEAVDQVDAMMLAPYRLRAWNSRVDGKRGNKPIQDKPFEWILSGRTGWPGAPAVAPSVPAAAVSPAAPIGGLHRDEMKEWATAVAERDAMALRLAEMERRLQELESDEPDDDDDDDESVNGSPAHWLNTEAGAAIAKELAGSLSSFLRAKAAQLNGTAPRFDPPAPTPNSDAGAPAAEGITADEIRLVQAFRNLAATKPDEAGMYAAMLIQEHGNPAPQHEQRETV